MCIMADSRRMMMINWDGLDEDDEEFFDSKNRISSVVSIRVTTDDDENYDDSRISFASAISTSPEEFRSYAMSASSEDYNVWMAEPGSIQDRRQRLLQDMGLTKDKEPLRITSMERKPAEKVLAEEPKQENSHSHSRSPSSSPTENLISRSKSEANLLSDYAISKSREESFTFTNDGSKRWLLRFFSMPAQSNSVPSSMSDCNMQLKSNTIKPSRTKSRSRSKDGGIGHILSINTDPGGGGFLIKNLDTGKVFMINEDGTTSSLNDLQTGKQLSMEEFEKSVGHSPIVKELMRRENVSRSPGDNGNDDAERKLLSSSLNKSFRSSGKKKAPNWLKNIKGVANSLNGFIDREKETHQQSNGTPSKWTKVHQHGKAFKDITGLYMCQEIQAHEGSIWSMKFSCDGQYLASAGEDRVIHVWEVVDCDVLSGKTIDDVNSTPLHPLVGNTSVHPPLVEAPGFPSERRKRGRLASGSKKKGSISEYVIVPDTVFSLSDKPVCSFEGHLDDVLDLSWSKNNLLLSSSMDKTVRLWDMETQACLKLFAHNDYVTCIQFNPVDDEYFISGSLDAKIRIWSVPERKVVDWSDMHEMVTAVCYTPDGQGALVGSNRGSCRLYDTSEYKLQQKGHIVVQNKKKSQAKKITGFQFVPGNTSEVLITSADSRIRIFDGTDITHKFRGFKNTNSQISATFTLDGKYIISASEDSQVYVWKHDDCRNSHGGKSKGLISTQSYERFQCKDVSIAIPWPGSLKYDPSIFLSKKLNSKGTSISSNNSTQQEPFLPSASVGRNLPPLPRKNSVSEKDVVYPEEEPCTLEATFSRTPSTVSRANSSASAVSRMNSNINQANCEGEDGSIFGSAFGSPRRDESSITAGENLFPSFSWLFDGGTNSTPNNTALPSAWGLVVVTAGIGGELKIYQNFGMPVRVGRQASLFASSSVRSSTNKRFV